MARPESAGLLLYRRQDAGFRFFLVHPGGPFWTRKDLGAWTIPKGEIGPGEEPLIAAKREFLEETGFAPTGSVRPLAVIRQSGGKRVHAWLVEGDLDPAQLRSGSFQLEWPPKSGRLQDFPEVDRGAWFTLEEALAKILPSQAPLLREAADLLA